MIANHVQKCIDAAEEVMTLVDGLGKQGILIQSFWFTHYVCFCAIIVVYIHTIQQHRQSPSPPPGQGLSDPKLGYLFSLAEACQQHLAEATRRNCPSRRYSIILEELRLEVHKQIATSMQPPNLIPCDNVPSKPPPPDSFLGQRPFAPGPISQPISFEPNPVSYPPVQSILPPLDSAQGPLDTGEEMEFLETLEGSNWWAQLDSWVSTLLSLVCVVDDSDMYLQGFSNLSNDSSVFTL